MAEYSGFFDAHLKDGEYDRTYLAADFAKYFASFIGNGIFGGKLNELMVQQKETADMSIKVLSGKGYINGYQYENDDDFSLSIDIADGVLSRIDLVVLRWDKQERTIRLAVKKGVSATNPGAPVLQRDADRFELKLAEIYIKAGATSITQASITDTRLNKNVCGLVTGVINQLDTTDLGNQLQSFINQYSADYEAYIEQLKLESAEDKNNIIENFITWINQFKIDSEAEVRALINMLNGLVVDVNNDLINIRLDVNEIKETLQNGVLPAVESEEFPGCFYKVIDGEVEWINTPGQYGVEYRTFERYQGKPVYEKTIYVASLSNIAITKVNTGFPGDKVISTDGYLVSSTNEYRPLPIVSLQSVDVIGHLSGIDKDGVLSLYGSTSYLNGYKSYIKIKYTKI